MARVEKSIEIEVTPDRIWEMLFWDRIPEWLEGIKEAIYTSEEKRNVGATAHVKAETAGVKVEFGVEITEYVENEGAAWRTTAGNFTAIGSTILKPTKIGTELTLMMDYELPYSILGKIVDKVLVSKETADGFQEGLEKLKEMLE